jgi:hypothetical protein
MKENMRKKSEKHFVHANKKKPQLQNGDSHVLLRILGQ